MRDSTRIERITNLLAQYWLKVPDWWFGQLIENIKLYYAIEDLFYIEDDKFEELLKGFFEANVDSIR